MKHPKKESIEKVFYALTEFHRALGNKNAESVNFYMNKQNIPVNLHAFIKKELLSRHLVKSDFSVWSTERSLPTMAMAESILIAAYAAFNEHKASRLTQQSTNQPSIISKDIIKHVNALKALGVKEVQLTF